MLREALAKVEVVERSRWRLGALALRKVARAPSLEGRYRLCAKVYLRLMGGVRRDKQLRADVNRWEASTRCFKTAGDMMEAVRSLQPMAVTTSSIHKAKGDEWDYVFVVGVTEGHLPHHTADDDLAIAEERNLLYVAITRARERVYLCHAPTNHARRRCRFSALSRFLEEKRVQKTLMNE